MPPRAAGKDFALPTGVNGETQEQELIIDFIVTYPLRAHSHVSLSACTGNRLCFSRIQAPLWVEAKEATKILFLIFSSAVDFSDKHENVVNTDISQCYGSDMQREGRMMIVESE